MAMKAQNGFLLRHSDAHCFCVICRVQRYDIIVGINYTNNEMHDLFMHELFLEEEEKLDQLYHTTLQKIYMERLLKTLALEAPVINILRLGLRIIMHIFLQKS